MLAAFIVLAVLVALGALTRLDRTILDVVQLPHASWLDLAASVLSRKFSPFDRSIDMHVSKVRKKLGDSDGGTDHIKTVRGVGYIFARPRDTASPDEARRGAE